MGWKWNCKLLWSYIPLYRHRSWNNRGHSVHQRTIRSIYHPLLVTTWLSLNYGSPFYFFSTHRLNIIGWLHRHRFCSLLVARCSEEGRRRKSRPRGLPVGRCENCGNRLLCNKHSILTASFALTFDTSTLDLKSECICRCLLLLNDCYHYSRHN